MKPEVHLHAGQKISRTSLFSFSLLFIAAGLAPGGATYVKVFTFAIAALFCCVASSKIAFSFPSRRFQWNCMPPISRVLLAASVLLLVAAKAVEILDV